MSALVREASESDVRHVIANMRAEDAEEQLNGDTPTREVLTSLLLAARAIQIKNYAFLDLEGQPAALLGAYLTGPRHATLHRCSTSAWRDVGFTMFRFGREYFVPTVLVPNVSHASCRVLAKHRLALEILRRLGFAPQGQPGPEGFVELEWKNAAIDAAGARIA